MRFDGNHGAQPNYEPNSFGGPKETAQYRERPKEVAGTVDRHNHRLDSDYYTQPGNLFRLMAADTKQRLIGNIVASMSSVPRPNPGAANPALLQSRSSLRHRRSQRSGLQIEQIVNQKQQTAASAAD